MCVSRIKLLIFFVFLFVMFLSDRGKATEKTLIEDEDLHFRLGDDTVFIYDSTDYDNIVAVIPFQLKYSGSLQFTTKQIGFRIKFDDGKVTYAACSVHTANWPGVKYSYYRRGRVDIDLLRSTFMDLPDEYTTYAYVYFTLGCMTDYNYISIDSGGHRNFVQVSSIERIFPPEENCESGWIYLYAPYIHRGDADGDGTVNMQDIVFLIDYLYKGGETPDPIESGDPDCNCAFNILDITYLIDYLYRNGPEPGC